MREVKEIFASIDGMNADAFVAHLTEDVTFRFGNAEAVHGRAAVAEAVNGFWGTIGGRCGAPAGGFPAPLPLARRGSVGGDRVRLPGGGR